MNYVDSIVSWLPSSIIIERIVVDSPKSIFLTLASFTILIIITNYVCRHVFSILQNRANTGFSGKEFELPPLSPSDHKGGPIGCLKELISPSGPDFMLNLFRSMTEDTCSDKRMKNRIFRLPLPIPGSPSGIVVIVHPLLAKKILSDPKNSKPWLAYKFTDWIVGGQNFFSSEGERNRHVRAAVSPAFSQINIERLGHLIQDLVELWIQKKFQLSASTSKDSVVKIDCSNEMVRLILRITMQFGFEYDISDQEAEVFEEAVSCSYTEHFRYTFASPMRQIFPWAFEGGRKARHATGKMKDFARNVLYSFREKENIDKSTCNNSNPATRDAGRSGSMLSHLVADKLYRTDEERICDILVLLLGSYETTAATVGLIMLELARNQREQEKLYNDLRTYKSVSEAASESRILKAVVREAMRLHPSIPLGSMRELSKPVTFGKYIIPQGYTVIIPSLLLHRDFAVFEEPDTFKPDRWLNEEESKRLSQSFLPFSSGRRNCIGQSIAMKQITIILVRLFSEFQFQVVQEGSLDYTLSIKTVNTILSMKKRVDQS